MLEALKVEKDTMFWNGELPEFGVEVYPSGTRCNVAQTRAGTDAVARTGASLNTFPGRQR